MGILSIRNSVKRFLGLESGNVAIEGQNDMTNKAEVEGEDHTIQSPSPTSAKEETDNGQMSEGSGKGENPLNSDPGIGDATKPNAPATPTIASEEGTMAAPASVRESESGEPVPGKIDTTTLPKEPNADAKEEREEEEVEGKTADVGRQTLRRFFEKLLESQEPDLTRLQRDLVAPYLEYVEHHEATLLRATQTLEQELKEAGRGAKGAVKQGLLRAVINVVDKIYAQKLTSLVDVREELSTLLQMNDLVEIEVREGDLFDADRHTAIGTKTTDDKSRDRTIALVRSTSWRYHDEDRPLVMPQVVVWKYRPKDSQSK